ncbi:hypothetical protein RHGRI_015989 [Rhododendron griersonianum]|uniref:Uncharacterized protein n=1 Tax=Rhododendron griersonianum TaxID=479676 RepID=A0AAV6JSU1_9ERIC|nr:hypothetical protein RHGRI_015989 [Rhododendron griersonianum]
MIGLSKTTSSPSDFVGKLVDFGLSPSNETRNFAEEIYGKVPRKASGINVYQKQEREAALLVRKQKAYSLLEAGDDDDHDVGGGSGNGSHIPAASEVRKADDSRKKRFRKKTENDQEDEDDEVAANMEEERRVKRRTNDDSESEEEILRDQREREELEHHLKDRDAAATRKLGEAKPTRRKEEGSVRRSNNALEQDGTNTLRKVSRQKYLKKREEKILDQLRDDIEDEQYLFNGVKLTEAEYRKLRYKKEIYELVKKRSEDADSIDGYRMPEAYDQEGGVNQEKRFSVAMQRYRDSGAGDNRNPFAEQEAWEEHQIGKATLKYGSKDRKQKSDEFQFVFEDQIDFIKASVMDGCQI